MTLETKRLAVNDREYNPYIKEIAGQQTIANSAFVHLENIDPTAIGEIELYLIGDSAKWSGKCRINYDVGTQYYLHPYNVGNQVEADTSLIRFDVTWALNTVAITLNSSTAPTQLQLYCAGGDFNGGTIDVRWVQRIWV